jgi:hypothetical protein
MSDESPMSGKPVKVGLNLSPLSARRLVTTSIMDGRTRSEIVDDLIARHLTRYVVQDLAAAEPPARPAASTPRRKARPDA